MVFILFDGHCKYFRNVFCNAIVAVQIRNENYCRAVVYVRDCNDGILSYLGNNNTLPITRSRFNYQPWYTKFKKSLPIVCESHL